MTMAVRMATSVMGEEKLKEVVRFNRKVSQGTAEVEADPDDPLAEIMALWTRPFLPSLMNSTVFLVETAQIIGVLFVNYKGRPWMLGMLENHMLALSLSLCIGGVAFLAWEQMPEVNKMLHLEPFPDDAYRVQVMSLVLACIFGTFLWDRLITAIFAPDVFRAMLREAKSTRPKDVLPMFWTIVKVMGGFMIFGTGNPLIWLGSWMFYKRIYLPAKERNEAMQLARARGQPGAPQRQGQA